MHAEWLELSPAALLHTARAVEPTSCKVSVLSCLQCIGQEGVGKKVYCTAAHRKKSDRSMLRPKDW